MTTKIILLAVLIVLLTGCSAGVAVDTEAETVFETASKIAEIDLPSGYSADFSAHMLGYTAAAFNPGDGHSHLYLIQSEKESDGEKLASILNQIAPGTYDPQTRMTVIETRPVTVREQEGTLSISEGVTSEGESYRQAVVAFHGKGGPALVVLSEPVTRWNQETVDAFIASIR